MSAHDIHAYLVLVSHVCLIGRGCFLEHLAEPLTLFFKDMKEKQGTDIFLIVLQLDQFGLTQYIILTIVVWLFISNFPILYSMYNCPLQSWNLKSDSKSLVFSLTQNQQKYGCEHISLGWKKCQKKKR